MAASSSKSAENRWITPVTEPAKADGHNRLSMALVYPTRMHQRQADTERLYLTDDGSYV
jgi:hypothetical protein